jgi:hypothetical protein
MNIAIVMYSHAPLFEQLCGPLFNFKTIHLTRNALDTAKSAAQWQADRDTSPDRCRAHYRVDQHIPKHMKIPPGRVEAFTKEIEDRQKRAVRRLTLHCDVYTVSYEDLSQNKQTNQFERKMAEPLLKFLGLEYHPLRNSLRKVSGRTTDDDPIVDQLKANGTEQVPQQMA